jgi:hypothetical protein
MQTANESEVLKILHDAKLLARRYHELTGKPLGVTGEVAEYEAHRLLDLELTEARNAGYDATECDGAGRIRKLQIKGRCVLPGCKPGRRVGRIDVKKDFDAVLLVLLDENFDATVIYEAPRMALLEALSAPGSLARNERGALSVSKFKAIGKLRWKAMGRIIARRSFERVGSFQLRLRPMPISEPRHHRPRNVVRAREASECS